MESSIMRYSFVTKSLIFLGLISAQLHLYSMQMVNYHSAGILPYAVMSNNEVVILLGLEPLRNNFAFDFGGKKDPEDKNNPAFTAAREGSEELLFIFDNDQTFQQLLMYKKKYQNNFMMYRTSASTYWTIVHFIENNPIVSMSNGYLTYFIKINYDPHLPAAFLARKKMPGIPPSWNEKGELYWVKLQDLIAALNQSKNLQQVDVVVNNGSKKIRLFEPVAISLKTALNNGVLKNLK